MRIMIAIAAGAVATGVASAQAPGSTPWSSNQFPVSLDLPAGWTNKSGDPEVFEKEKASSGEVREGFCVLAHIKAPPQDPDEPSFTQEDLNKGTAPLPLSDWQAMTSKFGLDRLTWLESRPTFLVDGKAAVNARGADDNRGVRSLVHMAQVLTPSGLYSFTCLFPTSRPPYEETASFRASTLAEFEQMLRSLRIKAPT